MVHHASSRTNWLLIRTSTRENVLLHSRLWEWGLFCNSLIPQRETHLGCFLLLFNTLCHSKPSEKNSQTACSMKFPAQYRSNLQLEIQLAWPTGLLESFIIFLWQTHWTPRGVSQFCDKQVSSFITTEDTTNNMDVRVVNVFPPLGGTTKMFVGDAFSLSLWLHHTPEQSDESTSTFVRPQLWTNVIHAHNVAGSWHAIGMCYQRFLVFGPHKLLCKLITVVAIIHFPTPTLSFHFALLPQQCKFD